MEIGEKGDFEILERGGQSRDSERALIDFQPARFQQ
jgi:hypothetical protein